MIEQLIAEATECDFKVALETKKPKQTYFIFHFELNTSYLPNN